ncbi:unnamed protein product, partial [marine sediment metagenome]
RPSNIFSVVFNNTISSLLKIFPGTKLIEKIVHFIIRLITIGITFLFVWATASLVISPWFFSYAHNYCGSGLAAKDVGVWIAGFYIFIYILYEIPDFFIDRAQALVDIAEDPLIVKGIAGPTLQSARRTWDIIKYGGLYLIPFFGQLMLQYHEIIEESIGLLYEAIAAIDTFQCNDKKTANGLCSLLTGLQETLSGVRKENGRVFKNNLKKKGSDKGKEILKEKEAASSEILATLGNKELIPIVKNYHLSPLINLLQRGFCDSAIKESGKKIPELEGTKWDTSTRGGQFNRWSAGTMTSVFCQFTEAVDDVQKVLGEVGTEDQIIDMIKTGNVAGMGASGLLVIFFILSIFKSSFGGHEYK